MKGEIREVGWAQRELSPTLILIDRAMLGIVSLTLAFHWTECGPSNDAISFQVRAKSLFRNQDLCPQSVVNTFSTYTSDKAESLFPRGVWWKNRNLPSIKSLMCPCKRRLLFFKKRPAGPKKGEKATSLVAPAFASMNIGLIDLPFDYERRNKGGWLSAERTVTNPNPNR